MTQIRLTINVNVQYVKDWGATLRFLRALDPVAVVAVIDTLSAKPRVLELKAALPNAKIIVRCVIVVEEGKQLDGSMYLAPHNGQQWLVSPGNFLDKWGELGQAGLSLSYLNEPMIAKAQPADIARQVQHMIETIGLATTRGISLCAGNWGVAHYLDERFDDVIEIMGKQRNLHMLGVHAYAPVDTFNCIDAILERCTVRNFVKPRIGITEFGWDTTGNGDPLNGYKSQPTVNTGVKFGNWEIDKTKNVYSPYIQRGELEFIATFGWGYAASFPNDDVETDTGWQDTILKAAQEGKLTIDAQTTPTVKPTVPAPANKGGATPVTLTGTVNWNLHTTPEVNATKVGSVHPGEAIKLYGTTIQPNGGFNFYFVERVASPDTESASGWMVYTGAVAAPPTTSDPVPPVTVPPPVTTPPITLPPDPVETLYTYTVSFSIRSPLIPSASLTAIENGIRAILSGVVWLGAGLGNAAEFDVHVQQESAANAATGTLAA